VHPGASRFPNDCLSCTLRQTCDFCNLPQPLMSEFNSMGHLTLYPANATFAGRKVKFRAASTSPVPAGLSSRWKPVMVRRSS